MVTVALAVAVVALTGTTWSARRAWHESDEALWAATWAHIHTINGTVPKDAVILGEYEEARACAGRWLDDGYPEDVR